MAKFLSLEGLTTIIAKLKSYFAAKGEAIKSITGSGNKSLTYTRADGSTGTIGYQDTTYGTGNTSTAGLTKLYTSLGTQTDGAPTNSLLNAQVSTLNTAIGDKLGKDSIVQTTGTATDKVMSQKSVTDVLQNRQNKLTAGDDATRLNGAKLSTKQIFTGSIDTTAGAVPMLLPAGSCIYN